MGHVSAAMSAGDDRIQPRARRDPLVEIYLDRRQNLVRFFAARTGSSAAAEDLAQELYLKLITREPEGVADNPPALLYRIAMNLMLDRARGEARAVARDAAWRRTAHLSLGGEDVAPDPAPDDAAEAQVGGALKALTARLGR